MKQFELITKAYSKDAKTYSIGTGGLLIGRSPRADIQLDDSQVSRLHARVHVEDDGIVIEDLDSLNGTQINGEAIIEMEVRVGDRIQIGGVELLFTARDVAVPAELREDDSIIYRDFSPSMLRKTEPEGALALSGSR